MSTSRGLRVVAYLRRSSPGEEDKNYSIENQLKDINAWAEQQGHIVVREYSDPGGKSFTLNRPVLQRLMADARTRAFDIVCVGRFDRFSRIQVQCTVAIYQLREMGVSVVSATEDLPEGVIGDFLRNGIIFAAEHQLETIRAATYGGKKARVHSGKLPAMNCPKYGYQFADEKKERFVFDPNTAPIVQRIFASYVKGDTIRAIAYALMKDGIPTPSAYQHSQGWRLKSPAAKGWGTTGIRHILTDHSYTGNMVGMEYTRVPQTIIHPITGEARVVMRRVKRAQDDPLRYEYDADVCPALINEEAFASAQRRLEENQEMSSRNLSHAAEVLVRAPLGVCGYCGGTLSTKYEAKRSYHFYWCANRQRFGAGGQEGACTNPGVVIIKTETLDTACWSWFVEQLTHPERLREQYTLYLENVEEATVQETSQRTAIEAARKEALEHEESYLASVGSAKTDAMRERFIQLAEEAHAQYLSLTDALEESVATEAAHREQVQVIQSFQDAAPVALRNLEGASIRDKRMILYRFGVRAILWGRQHEPAYEFRWVFDSLCSDPRVGAR